MSLNLNHNFKNSLPIDLETFGFTQREKAGDKRVIFRCGRDFLYYTLHYYQPDRYNPKKLAPKKIEDEKVFGMRLPWWLMWTALQFNRTPRLLSDNNLVFKINGNRLTSYFDFFKAFIAPNRISVKEAIKTVEKSVDLRVVAGIDISLGFLD